MTLHRDVVATAKILAAIRRDLLRAGPRSDERPAVYAGRVAERKEGPDVAAVAAIERTASPQS